MSEAQPGAAPAADAVRGGPPTTAALARSVLPALVVGVLSAVALWAVSALAEAVDHVVWDALPEGWGWDTAALPWWWTVLVLTVTGLLVGATVRWTPGHAGHDPASTGLVDPPLPVRTVPGLAVALMLGLAGGVSLGPENPIIAINVALAVWLLARPRAGVAPLAASTLAVSGTIGAMFGTPVAAVLLLTETLAEKGARAGRLFDALFAPLVAAGAGSVTMLLIGEPTFSVSLPDAPSPTFGALLGACVVALVAALVMGLGAVAFPLVHRVFHTLRHPVLALGLGGLVLGLLGVLGGEVSLFKGLQQMKELSETVGDHTWWGLLGLALVKVLAVVVASGSGFRGGRIFPAAFVGVAVGLSASVLVPSLPSPYAVAAGLLGTVLVASGSAWMALFLAAVVVGDPVILPVLSVALAPLWLAARLLPRFELEKPPAGRPEFAALAPRAPRGDGGSRPTAS